MVMLTALMNESFECGWRMVLSSRFDDSKLCVCAAA